VPVIGTCTGRRVDIDSLVTITCICMTECLFTISARLQTTLNGQNGSRCVQLKAEVQSPKGGKRYLNAGYRIDRNGASSSLALLL